MISLTITRTALALPNLVIGSDPLVGSYHLPEDGLSWPQFVMRKVYAPESEFVAGRVKLSQVAGVGTLPTMIYARGATTLAMWAAMDALEAACTQFDFNVTISIDGEVRTYRAEGDFPQWGEVDPGMVGGHLTRATVQFSLYPGAS